MPLGNDNYAMPPSTAYGWTLATGFSRVGILTVAYGSHNLAWSHIPVRAELMAVRFSHTGTHLYTATFKIISTFSNQGSEQQVLIQAGWSDEQLSIGLIVLPQL